MNVRIPTLQPPAEAEVTVGASEAEVDWLLDATVSSFHARMRAYFVICRPAPQLSIPKSALFDKTFNKMFKICFVYEKLP